MYVAHALEVDDLGTTTEFYMDSSLNLLRGLKFSLDPKVHVAIWYLLGPKSSYMRTLLGPKFLLDPNPTR